MQPQRPIYSWRPKNTKGKYVVDGGIMLIKIWLEVGQEEQEKRFAARIDDPLRQWKLSPMDLDPIADGTITRARVT